MVLLLLGAFFVFIGKSRFNVVIVVVAFPVDLVEKDLTSSESVGANS